MLFTNIRLNRETGVLEADVEYRDCDYVVQGHVGYRLSDEAFLGLENEEGYYRRQILKGMICVNRYYREGKIKDGGKKSIVWG